MRILWESTLEFILESTFHIPIENQKARTWFRTIFMSTLITAVDALCILAWSRYGGGAMNR